MTGGFHAADRTEQASRSGARRVRPAPSHRAPALRPRGPGVRELCRRHETNETRIRGPRNPADAPAPYTAELWTAKGGSVIRPEFPRDAVLPHIDYARRAPLRAAGLFTAVGAASALGYALGLAAAIGLGAMVSTTLA